MDEYFGRGGKAAAGGWNSTNEELNKGILIGVGIFFVGGLVLMVLLYIYSKLKKRCKKSK